ncbi:Hypothetical_protein [Hexamita inflata]|uniref:Hypothetical_protein n=1 Tax=Hexamita inflata TaxID=28002 RepID=A0AA86UUF0_9EUKA|nr:Hypothetical protein HINF_LOCUS52907 [Hexamita inflata]
MAKYQCFFVFWLTTMCIALLTFGILLCFSKVSIETPFYKIIPPQNKYDNYHFVENVKIDIIKLNMGVGIMMAIIGFFGMVFVPCLYKYLKVTSVKQQVQQQPVQQQEQLVNNQVQKPFNSLDVEQQQQMQIRKGKFADQIQKWY